MAINIHKVYKYICNLKNYLLAQEYEKNPSNQKELILNEMSTKHYITQLAAT